MPIGGDIMHKQELINYIRERKQFINLKQICEYVGVNRQALYYCLAGIDYALSYEKLESVVKFIKQL